MWLLTGIIAGISLFTNIVLLFCILNIKRQSNNSNDHKFNNINIEDISLDNIPTTVAIDKDGKLWIWGNDSRGQCDITDK